MSSASQAQGCQAGRGRRRSRVSSFEGPSGRGAPTPVEPAGSAMAQAAVGSTGIGGGVRSFQRSHEA